MKLDVPCLLDLCGIIDHRAILVILPILVIRPIRAVRVIRPILVRAVPATTNRRHAHLAMHAYHDGPPSSRVLHATLRVVQREANTARVSGGACVRQL